MGLLEQIKSEALSKGVRVADSETQKLELILDQMFYCDHNKRWEIRFLTDVMTRGLESSERKGLHASAMIVPEKNFCLRQQVLSLHYKQLQGQQHKASLLKIFEEGNAIHEKWQRFFIRAGYSQPQWLDRTRVDEDFRVSYSPDVICKIPDFYPGRMVCEIKSMNDYSYRTNEKHPSAWKQLQLYMFLLRKRAGVLDSDSPNYGKGFVLCENKNTQESRVEIYNFDKEAVKPYVDRLIQVQESDEKFLTEKKPPKRHVLCSSSDCEMAAKCPMRDACWNVGMGRVNL